VLGRIVRACRATLGFADDAGACAPLATVALTLPSLPPTPPQSPSQNSRWPVGVIELPPLADRQYRAADLSKVGGQVSASPRVAAERFVAWINQHGLAAQAWTVDEVWYLAETDYGPAAGVTLPKRNTFLRALKQCAGVRFAYDERVRRGGNIVKSTIYRFDVPAPIQLAFDLAA
jgi:hypothetical protein